ncbi:MAG: flavodoxin family protein [Planctomycetota bacterium]|nr:MAG: flavodoxin family protein [Planctomycetota bacterium]
MKIIGINCSPRKGQTTQKSLEICLKAVHNEPNNIETDIIELADLDIYGCLGCGYCKKQLKCQQKDDFNSLIPVLSDEEVAGIIIATPVYLGTMTSQCKAFLDRTVVLARNGSLLRNKVGGVLAVGDVRNGGQELTIQAIQAAMFCHDMICVGGGTRAAHFGAALVSDQQKGIECDETGLESARDLGYKVAGLAILFNRNSNVVKKNKKTETTLKLT